MAEQNQNSEGSPWFWRIFGGTIMGAVVFLLVAHISNINASNNEIKVEIRELRATLSSNKEKLTSFENIREKVAATEQSLKEMSDSKERIVGLEVNTKHLKEEIDSIRVANEKALEQIELVKEKIRPIEDPVEVKK